MRREIEDTGGWLVDLSALKWGRTTFVMVHYDLCRSITAEEIDTMTFPLDAALSGASGRFIVQLSEQGRVVAAK